ncbi:MAG: DUF2177 family protein [Asticcacaulis sp.]|uniref:DUF2177 family protein n=1 Tax=Asticcacaulis sp. TaxID=1872648 RepID=UPI003F7B7570
MRSVLTYAAVLAALLALDGVWLSTTSPIYHDAMASLLAERVNFAAAGAFYALYALGVTVLIVLPGASRLTTMLRGALFGLVAYATYDLTALAVIRDWPLSLSLLDMGWGMVITAVASLAGSLVPGRQP